MEAEKERRVILTLRFFSSIYKEVEHKTHLCIPLWHDVARVSEGVPKFMDEATSGLDPVVRDEVVEMFSEFTRDESHSILMSSHIVSDLEKICDYIAFIHKGKLLLCEEKDILLEEYGLIHCTRETLDGIAPSAVKGKKESPYGVEALVLRDAVPEGISISPVTIEELFVFMVKEA